MAGKTLAWHLNKNGMSDSVINDLLAMAKISNQYLGTFMFNNLPYFSSSELKQQSTSHFLIINVGHHFVTLCITPYYALYIDSIGLPIVHQEINNFIDQYSPRPIYFNTKQIQSFESSHCGLYAALFTLYFDQYEQHNMKMTFFKNPALLLKNDDKCIQYIKKLVVKKS